VIHAQPEKPKETGRFPKRERGETCFLGPTRGSEASKDGECFKESSFEKNRTVYLIKSYQKSKSYL